MWIYKFYCSQFLFLFDGDVCFFNKADESEIAKLISI